MRSANLGIAGPRKSSGTSRTGSRNPQCQCKSNPYLSASSMSVWPTRVCANAGSATNISTSRASMTGPWICASTPVSNTRPGSPTEGFGRRSRRILRASQNPLTVMPGTPSVSRTKRRPVRSGDAAVFNLRKQRGHHSVRFCKSADSAQGMRVFAAHEGNGGPCAYATEHQIARAKARRGPVGEPDQLERSILGTLGSQYAFGVVCPSE